MDKKYMLITGAGGGMGEAIISSLKADFFIFALDISGEKLEKYRDQPNVFPVACDIRSMDAINAAKAEIQKITNTLDVIINLAGITVMGSAIEVEPAVFENTMSVNMFAAYRINYAFFPMVRETRGRIINVTSEYAKYLGIPFHCFYTASKRANDIYFDSLRRELKRFDIRVIKIRLGAFDTQMVKNVSSQFDELVSTTRYYKEPLLKMKKLMVDEIKSAKAPIKVVRTFQKAVYARRPKRIYHVNNSLKMRLLSILPMGLQDRLLTRFF